MTLSELLNGLPEDYRPIAIQYAPAMLRMTGDEVIAWVQNMVGDELRAYKSIVDKMTPEELGPEMSDLAAQFRIDTAAARAHAALVLNVLKAVLSVILGAALAT